MKISIVTPSFNQGEFIEQTIDSVLSQKYPDMEYIIIDGGSSDKTVEIIKKYEKYLYYWISEKDGGQTEAINKGFRLSNGEIFNWLNSDDYYTDGTLQTVSDAFNESKSDVVLGYSEIFGKGYKNRLSKGTYFQKGDLERTIAWSQIDQPATFFRSRSLKSIMPLSENLKYLMDREMWLRYLFQFGISKIHHSEACLVNFRMHMQSKSVKENEGFNIERERMFASIFDQVGYSHYSSFIKQHLVSSAESFKYRFPMPERCVTIEFERVAAYFLLLLADENYAFNKTNISRDLLNLIKVDSLEKDDLTRMKKISRGLKYNIPFFKQIIKATQ